MRIIEEERAGRQTCLCSSRALGHEQPPRAEATRQAGAAEQASREANAGTVTRASQGLEGGSAAWQGLAAADWTPGTLTRIVVRCLDGLAPAAV
jgi:hypothetical protein